MIIIFIRWKYKGNEKYAYLETRYRDDNGKIRGRSRYLGKDPQGAIVKLTEYGEITLEQAEMLRKKFTHKKDLRRERDLCACNAKLELLIILEILSEHWDKNKDCRFKIVARDIVIAAGKMEDYHRHWKVLSDRGMEMYKRWSQLYTETASYRDENGERGKWGDHLLKTLEEYEGELILYELIPEVSNG